MLNGKKRGVSLASRKSRYGYIFVAPFLVGFLLFFLSPFIFFVSMAFSKMGMTDNGMAFTYVGFKNFKDLLTSDMQYLGDVFSSLASMGVILISVVLYSLFIAIILNQKFKGRFFVRAMFFLPVVVASGVAAISGNNDILIDNAQKVLGNMDGNTSVKMSENIAMTIINMFSSAQAANWFVKIIADLVAQIYNLTQASGVQILIFLAALQTISPSIYEAASIDGSTGWESFWKITFPLISPMLLVNAIYTAVDFLAGASNSVVNNIFVTGVKLDYAKSSSMGVIYFPIVLLAVGVVMLIISRFIYYENRNEK